MQIKWLVLILVLTATGCSPDTAPSSAQHEHQSTDVVTTAVATVAVPTLAGALEPSKMKTISYRGGVITFRIPAAWKEEYQPEGGGAFYDNNRAESGTLRLNVITFRAPAGKLPPDGLAYFTGEPKAKEARLSKTLHSDGLKFYRRDAEEAGEKLHVYTWQIAHCTPPDTLRVAIFTWTLLAAQSGDAEFKKEVEILDGEIAKAQFHPGL